VLAILSGPRGRLIRAEFGDPLGLPEECKALLRWVFEDYPRRRDEQWRCAPPQGSPPAAELLNEVTDPALVAAALLALGWYGLPENGLELIRFVEHPEALVRRAAVRGLGQIGWVPALPEMEKKLEDPDAQVRDEALVSLAKYGRPETLQRVTAVAPGDPDGAAIVEHATRRTRALSKDDIPAFVEVTLKSPHYEDLCVWMPFIWDQLAQIPPDRARSLEVRLRATRLLGLGRARKSARPLIDTLSHPKTPPPLRVACVVALGRFGLPGTVDFLLPLLEAEEPELQLAAIAAVGGTGSPRGLLPLLGLWNARQKTLREPVRLAVRALGRSPVADALLAGWSRPAEGEPELTAAALDQDRWTTKEAAVWVRPQLARPEAAARLDAVAVLALIGHASDLAALERLVAQDPDEDVRWMAAAAARSIAGGDVTP